MTPAAYGLIGAFGGIFLGFILNWLKEKSSKLTKLYVAIEDVTLILPVTNPYANPVEGIVTIYIYNGSSIVKSFTPVSLVIQNIKLTLKEVILPERLFARAVQVLPYTAEVLRIKTTYEIEPGYEIPDLNDKSAILTYRIGKKVKKANLAASAYWDITRDIESLM